MDILEKDKITKFIDVIRKSIDKNNDKIIKRKNSYPNKQINLSDLIVYEMLKLHKSSGIIAANNISDNISKKISNQSYCNKYDQLDIKYIESIRDDIRDFIYNHPINNDIYNSKIYGCDGSQCNISLKLNNYGYKKSISNEYCIANISSIYDINNNITSDIYISDGNMDERSMLLKQLHVLEKGSILVLDRGYFSNDLLMALNKKEIYYIFRMKSSSKYIKQIKNNENIADINIVIEYDDDNDDDNDDDYDINGNDEYTNEFMDEHINSDSDDELDEISDEVENILNYNHKIIKYTINNNNYYLLTNIKDKTVNELSDLYWKRWNVETSFRKIKEDILINGLRSQKNDTIRKDIIILNIIELIISYIDRLKIYDNKKINSKNTIDSFFNKLIYYIIYEDLNLKNNMEFIKPLILTKNQLSLLIKTHKINNKEKIFKLLTTIITTTEKIRKNRHFRRVRKKPSTKWNRSGTRFWHI